MPKTQKYKGFGVNSSPNSSKNDSRYQGNSHTHENHSHYPHCLRNFKICVSTIAGKIGEARGEALSVGEALAIADEFSKANAISKTLDVNAVIFSFRGFAILVKNSWMVAPNPKTIDQGVKVAALKGGIA